MKTSYFSCLKSLFSSAPRTSRTLWIVAFYWAMATVLPVVNVLFKFKPEITDFSNHILSNASLNGIDIGGRIQSYYLSFTAVLFLTIVYYLGINWVSNRMVHASKKMIQSLEQLSWIGIFSLVGGISFSWLDSASYFLGWITVLLIWEIRTNSWQQQINRTLWPVFMAFPFVMGVYLYLKVQNFYQFVTPELKIKDTIISIDFQLLTFLFLLIITTLLFYKLGLKLKSKTNLFSSSLAIAVSLPIISITMELLNVFNVRWGIIFQHPFLLYAVLLFLGTVVFFICLSSTKKESTTVFENWFLPLFLLGFLMIMAQPWRMYSPTNEFFETANHGLSVDHFFRYGSIPMIETFDAHMFSLQFFAYLYGILNGYEPWSPFLYVFYYFIIEVFITFYILKKTLGTLNSFFIVLCVPFLTVIQNEFGLAGLLALTLLHLMRNPLERKRNLIFWSSAVLLCLYKLDVGFASVASSIIIYLSYLFLKKEKVGFRKFIVSGAIFGGSILGLFILLCIIKGIPPFVRLQEFFILSMSNQSWGVFKMGDMDHLLFRLAYYLFPILNVSLLVGVIISYLQKKKQFQFDFNSKKSIALLFFVFFTLFFLLNAPRGIVRHNFEYLNIIRITSTIPIALLMYIIYRKGKLGMPYFLATFLGMYLVLGATNPNFNKRGSALFSQAVNSGSWFEKFLPAEDFKGTRVRSTLVNAPEVAQFKKLLDILLSPDETYYDFSSFNYYHALVGRKNPSYINQTPLMINGDKAQEIELKQIKNQNIPLILMPIKGNVWHAVDEVFTDMKYYLMSEYIYQKYQPLYRMGSFDVYVLKSRAKVFLSKLERAGFLETKKTLTDFTFLTNPSIQNNNLQVVLNPDKTASITSPGSNAFFIGILGHLKSTGILPSTSSAVNFRFVMDATYTGNIKIYYKFNPEESFSESQVKELTIQQGFNSLTMTLPKMPNEIMVAVNTSSIIWKEFGIDIGSQSNLKTPEPIDYNTGFISKLWAEKSKETCFDKVLPLQKEEEGKIFDFDPHQLNTQSKGAYVFFELQSDLDFTANLELLVAGQMKANYRINIQSGIHKYAVRVSNGYYWWNSIQPKFQLKLDNVARLKRAAVLTFDGSIIHNYKAKGLQLAELNDENWKNGCSVNYKMLVMDYSPKIEKLVKSHKKIKATDGSTLTITGCYSAGNYLNITVAKLTSKDIQSFGAPKQIEFVNF